MIVQVRLFDVYEGDRLPAGKKSLAVEVTFQPRDHTLTEAELEAAVGKVVAAVAKATGAAACVGQNAVQGRRPPPRPRLPRP